MNASPAASPLASPAVSFAAQLQQLAAPPRPAAPQLRPVVHAEQAAADEGRDLGAVVLTVKHSLQGQSFDDLFTKVPQQGAAGTRVAVYECTYASLAQIMAQLAATPLAAAPATVYEHLATDITHVPAESFVLNLECCSGCSEHGFDGCRADETAALWLAIKTFLDRGSFVMASDFSLKALLTDWKPEILGPNPFVRLSGTCSSSFDLSFDPAVLAECPSAQLATVGQLATGGRARSHAMPSTILYALDQARVAAAEEEGSTIQVLTVASSIDGASAAQHLQWSGAGGGSVTLSQADGGGADEEPLAGLAGHVLLTRPSGGMLLTSMGHWIELVNLDVSERSLLSAAQGFSPEFQAEMEGELSSSRTEEERSATVQRYSCKMVSMSSPCSPAARRR